MPAEYRSLPRARPSFRRAGPPERLPPGGAAHEPQERLVDGSETPVARIGEVPLPAERKADHRKLDQVADLQLEGGRIAGQGGDAQIPRDRALDRPVAPQLHARTD